MCCQYLNDCVSGVASVSSLLRYAHKWRKTHTHTHTHTLVYGHTHTNTCIWAHAHTLVYGHTHLNKYTMKSCLFQALESRLGSAIQKANQVVDASANSDVMTSAELERAADDVHATMESVVSAGLGKSHPLVKKATELKRSLRDEGSKIKVSAAHILLISESLLTQVP